MRQDGTSSNAAWRRADSTNDPAAVYNELHRRQLTDVETCRLAWEHAEDPMALCVAVTRAGLPAWLEAILLAVCLDESGMLGRRWRERKRELEDAVRAVEVARERGIDGPVQTWEVALKEAARAIQVQRDPNLSAVTPHAMDDAYDRVREGLSNPGRYYRAPDLAEHMERASAYLERRLTGG